ncbi:ribonuclease P protein component [Deinococcus peraridilitoris]|uniref:Ribonuclease P protein component n=1 Tax=Deinococcus peraridilitoris (strain DSM 19664 / LMG 22246 / CIP 109416 / KR-200) TaxID=937777 RepID=L0A4W1_DEIPD|nr:ribonuclease P protein component [Deinococcus peraridilitoris]AFZ68050.1 ribonuclease P protein component [Deinococcus peraridilitoris DSM 19664]
MTDRHQPSSPSRTRKRSAGLASLTGEREFRQVRKGKTVRTPYFTVRAVHYRPKHREPYRPMTIVGIVVSKKTLKSAVDRNRVRRRVREALRLLELPPCRAMVLPNPAVLSVDFAELQAQLKRAFDKAAP